MVITQHHRAVGLQEQFSGSHAMSNFFWLLFLDKSSSLEEFFTDINIPFDCEFLVAQPENDHAVGLTEVYRVSPTLPLQTYRFGNWTPDGGLTWPSRGFYHRRNNLQGLTLKTGLKLEGNNSESLNRVETKTFSGVVSRIWRQLENEMNFTTQYYEPEANTCNSSTSNASCAGINGMLQTGQVDVSNAATRMSAVRLATVDFTVPIGESRFYIVIKANDVFIKKWIVFATPFSLRLWIAVACIMVVSAICLTEIQVLERRNDEGNTEDFSFVTAMFLVVGVFCQQGHNISTKSTPVLLTFVTSYLTAVVLFACYSAGFVSYLTLRHSQLPFTDFKGFLKDGSFELLAMKRSVEWDYFKSSSDDVLREIYSKFLLRLEVSHPDTALEGLQRVCHHTKVAFIICTDDMMTYVDKINCTIVRIPEASFPASVAFALAKGSHFRGLFNHRLQQLRRNGVLNMWNWYVSSKMRHRVDPPKPSISIRVAKPILYVLAVGAVFAVGVLTVEICTKHISSVLRLAKGKLYAVQIG
ncbi:probable glutamate receptor isoform X5 [Zootermopsis nevadensis]|nr:probable glutamate receptor isoform X4 [Zootermopsis nevadensis]XP_021923398.1 probable glutamate receptor isoform X5 [Zootermopsis nevadensis]